MRHVENEQLNDMFLCDILSLYIFLEIFYKFIYSKSEEMYLLFLFLFLGYRL